MFGLDRYFARLILRRLPPLKSFSSSSFFFFIFSYLTMSFLHFLGAKTSMSHKCGELDKQVPYLMGVSKAIMENVIFCHQEESSWPLGDPASLKKKFDDIFESSRYSKALETIRKTRLEYANKVGSVG